jgi:putative oxidoreductase
VGLLFLRLIAAVYTAHNVVPAFAAEPSFRTGIECAAGLLLCAGLWTPIAGCALLVCALWAVFSGIGEPWTQIFLAALGAALAMLGPGAWSVDARLFGRKRII